MINHENRGQSHRPFLDTCPVIRLYCIRFVVLIDVFLTFNSVNRPNLMKPLILNFNLQFIFL